MDNEELEDLMVDTLIERPYMIEIDGKPYLFHPITLGKHYLQAKLIKSLEINESLLAVNPILETLRLASQKKDVVSRILAYNVLPKKKDVFNAEKVEKLINVFNSLESEDRATLLNVVLTSNRTSEIIKYLGIDKELARMKRAQSVKEKDNSISFCGKSAWGSLIDLACERYGWTYEYVVWGISLPALQILMADQIKTLILNEEERRKANVFKTEDTMDANNMSAEEIKNVLKL